MSKSFSLVSIRIYIIFSLTGNKVKAVVTGDLQLSALTKTTELTVQFVHPRKTSNTAVFPQTSYKTVVLVYIYAYKLSASHPQTKSP